MPRNIFRFSDEQLDKLINFINKDIPNKFNLDGVFKLIQLLAIIAAGIWTIYTYVTFQKGQQQLSLQQQQISKEQDELNLEQNKLLANTRRESEQVSLKQQEFDLTQKNLLANTQKDSAETALKQQKFSLEQNKLLAGTQIGLAKANLAQQEVSYKLQRLTLPATVSKSESEASIKKLEADAAAQKSVQTDVKPKITKVSTDGNGINTYNLELYMTVQNLSDRELDVTNAEISIYIGNLGIPYDTKVFKLNLPDNSYNEVNKPIEWHLELSQTYMSINATDSQRYPCLTSWVETSEIGGLASGRILRKEIYYATLNFQIRAKSTQFVGYSVKFYTDYCTKDRYMNRHRNYFILSEIK